MKTILETTDRSLVESLRLALEGEGIDVVVLDVGVTSLPFVPIHVRVPDEDFELAMQVLSTLHRTPRSAEPMLRLDHPGRALLLLLLAVLAIACLCL
jgi:hypothetical protein